LSAQLAPPPERDPAHGVGDVLIEAGKEAETVLAWKVLRPPVPVPGADMLRALPPKAARRS
jgi:hypothetical protein